MSAKTRKKPGRPRAEDHVRGLIAAGRFADALREALNLPNRPDLLHAAVVGRVKGWLAADQTEFACDLLRRVGPMLAGDPKRAVELAMLFAECGAAGDAMELVPGASPMRADLAVMFGTPARAGLDDAWQPAFDAVLRAFAEFRAGRDDEARAALTDIGLGSPFLEWKVAIRGLMAWHARDDAKALENWSRLDPARLPAKLIEPLRVTVDPKAQAPAGVLKKLGRLIGVPVVDDVLALGRELTHGTFLSVCQRLRKIRAGVGEANTNDPRFVTEAVAGAIMRQGGIAEVNDIAKILPALPHDPTFDLMRANVALATESGVPAANYLRKYEQVIVDRPTIWGDKTPRVRAMLWRKLSQCSAMRSGNPLYEVASRRAKDLVSPPDPITCLRQAVAVDPEYLPAREMLVSALFEAGQAAEARAEAEQVLRRRPDHTDILESLVEMTDPVTHPVEHLEQLRKWLAAHPLAPDAEPRLAAAHRAVARHLARSGDLDGARRELAEASRLVPTNAGPLAVALAWLAGEKKSAAALMQGCLDSGAMPAALALRILGEANAIGLKKWNRKPVVEMVKAALGRAMSADEAPQMVAAFAVMKTDRLTYHGIKTHSWVFERKAVSALVDARRSLDDHASLCEMCDLAEWFEALYCVAVAGCKQHPTDPRFPYYVAVGHLETEKRPDLHYVRDRLMKAEELYRNAPAAQRPDWLLDELEELRQTLPPTSPLDFLSEIFGHV